MMTQKPVLSIGMIFKNDARSLERCLKALRPLRDAIPCELVMADTGSADDSRRIAKQYADVLFDFPWIDDFSAARNAVIDRASGTWFLTVDSDEYLDPDVSELTGFLRDSRRKEVLGLVIQRNYDSLEMDGSYSDFYARRLVRLDAGFRYRGSIHESLETEDPSAPAAAIMMTHTILHHDGYVGLNEERGKAKRERNLKLLRQELEKTPDSLPRLFQYVESGIAKEPDAVIKLRRGLELVEERAPGWEQYGPALYRYAVYAALNRKLPELEDWAKRGEALFPDSYFTRIDTQSLMFAYDWNTKEDYADAVRRGEAYLRACADYDAAPVHLESRISTIAKASPADRQNMRVFLAFAYVKEGQPERALEQLESVDCTLLSGEMSGVLCTAFYTLHSRSELDTAPLLLRFWSELNAPAPSEQAAKERREAFDRESALAFSFQIQSEAASGKDYRRPGYTLFLPLAGQCPAGDFAALMEAGELQALEEILEKSRYINALPPMVLIRILHCGTAFPPVGNPLNMEDMDALATGLSQTPEELYDILLGTASWDLAGSWQTLAWARALALAAVRTCAWRGAGPERLDVARAFARVEGAFLPACYTQEVLQEDGLRVLPPMHRFGWYCAQAFDALEAGDVAGYVRFLRAGLERDPAMKDMVEYLTDNTPELQALKPSPELVVLAEKVRTMLVAYPPDDPAVAALKASPAYQKVAYLIEGDGT